MTTTGEVYAVTLTMADLAAIEAGASSTELLFENPRYREKHEETSKQIVDLLRAILARARPIGVEGSGR